MVINVKTTKLLLLLAVIVLMAASAACTGRKGRAIVLISLDTLRQDHLGCYGYGRNTSPNIDRFAREDAVLFDSAYCQAPYTLPSHMSILTGLYPKAHGVIGPTVQDGSGRKTRLEDGYTTLAEVLRDNGFFTSAFTDGLFLNRAHGFDQGFDEYRDERNPEHDRNGFRKYGEALHEWIEDNSHRDFFLFIHTYDTHAPFVPPEPFRSRFKDAPPGREIPPASMEHCSLLRCHANLDLAGYNSLQEVVDIYDGCVAFADDEVGKLFALLKDQGLWDDALVVVMSDHGESFMENGVVIGHGLCATNEETLIPLMIKPPGSPHAGRRVDHVVESVDVLPTVLACMNIPAPRDVQGQNLLDGIEKNRWKKNYAFGLAPQTGSNLYFVQNEVKFIEAVSDPDKKWVQQLLPMNPPASPKPETPYYTGKKRPFFYDFEADPLGLNEVFYRGDRAYDLSETRHEWQAEEITDETVLEEYKKAAYTIYNRSAEVGLKYKSETAGGEALSDEEREQLAALGYAGVLAVGSLDEGDRSPTTLIANEPLVDRRHLIAGDELLWALSRKIKRKAKRKDIEADLSEARLLYRKFEDQYPDRTPWVDWRLKFLDQISRSMQGAKPRK